MAAADGVWSTWPAPAKLNLFLNISGRRPDGLHLLQTVYQLLDWGDTVHFRVRRDGVIARDGDNAGIAERDDLVVRAASLLQSAAPTRLGADIRVDKRVPIGGGLGGGSSDAATTLRALNQLWKCGLDEAALVALGLQLGADVPVFVLGRSAFAQGVGEQLVPLDLPKCTYVIADPGVSIPTRELFQATELTRDSAAATIEGFVSGAATQNAFESVVRARYPAVARALDWLGESGRACLSGTGGCVFAAMDCDRAPGVVHRCPPEMRAWVANGINVSPLLASIDDQQR
jgi:4-diphosphocytidyl-2-C-methyl-D-erythritol kinase